MGLLLSETHGYVKDIVDEALKAAFILLSHLPYMYLAPCQAMLNNKSLMHRVAETKRYLMLKCHDEPGINAEHVGMNRAL